MKKMKKMIALLLAFTMVMAMGMSAMAAPDDEQGDGGDTPAAETVSITVKRDTATYAGEADADSRNFTWYRVFTASYGDDFTGNNGGGGYDTDGTPGTVTGDDENPVSYIASAAVAAKLGTWVAAAEEDDPDTDVDETKAHWEKATGNEWFALTPIVGTTTYNVTWDNTDTDADTAQAAAKWLVDNEVYDATGTLTFSGSGDTAAWSADGLEKGYYVLESEAGDNLIAATTDVEVNEKNDYPPLNKEQMDEEDGEEFGDDTVDVAVGDVIDYSVTVTIPNTAKVGDKILVWDKASQGLTFNNDLEAAPDTDVSDYDGTADADWTWYKLITVTAANKGTDIVFTFSMTVNDDAVVDTGKINESGLKYGRGSGDKPFPYESTPDKVEYKTYFAGIHKIDGDTEEDLDGVEFDLKEDGVAFNVTLTDGVYIPGGSSNKVVTDADGLIRIRGIDDDKTYTLTETLNPHEGYNMLTEDVTLTIHLDSVTEVTYTPATEYDAEAEYYTKDGDTYTAADVTEAEFNEAPEGTYFTKTEETSTFADADEDTWDEVENNKGTILPSTGGIGTTMFYVIGTVLVLGAAVLLISKRRMNVR